MKLTKENFDGIYLSYFSGLCRFAREYVLSDQAAENIVQNVFLLLWERHRVLQIQGTVSSYLYELVRNKCIDHLRHQKVAREYQAEMALKLAALEQMGTNTLPGEDIEQKVREAIDRLPEKCREIFLMSRVEGKKYAQIAEITELSVNTIENQISIALKKLRTDLKDFI